MLIILGKCIAISLPTQLEAVNWSSNQFIATVFNLKLIMSRVVRMRCELRARISMIPSSRIPIALIMSIFYHLENEFEKNKNKLHIQIFNL